MKLPSTLIVILCSLLLQVSSIVHKRYVSNLYLTKTRIAFFNGQGVFYLIYPLLGYLADVRLTRYRTVKLGLVFLVIGLILGILYSIGDIVATVENSNSYEHSLLSALLLFIGLLCMVVGIGLFQSNIIQFGLDQLLEAPTPKLIAFIHWYYWAQNVGELLFFYPLTTEYTIFSLTACNKTKHFADEINQAFLLTILVTLSSFITLALVLLCVFKKALLY